MEERHDRLRRARIDAGFARMSEAVARFGWNKNSYKSNENGNAPFSYAQAEAYAEAFGVRAAWLYSGTLPMHVGKPDLRLIIGRVGADPEGTVVMTSADAVFDYAPPPPGGTSASVALEVRGHSMHGWADDGALIYFEDQRTPPTPDLLGQVCIVETEDGRVLVKRLLRGSAPDRFDLESINGPTMSDVRLVWAAEVTAIIPPRQAGRVILRGAA